VKVATSGPGGGVLKQAAELDDIIWIADNYLLVVCNVNIDYVEHQLHKPQPVNTLIQTKHTRTVHR